MGGSSADARVSARPLGIATGTRPLTMQLEHPQRLAAIGIVGLAALSATDGLRENLSDPGPVLSFALGVMPNLEAAFAMPLLLASFTPRCSRAPITPASRSTYLWILAFTTSGLVGWEFMQTRSDRLVFDVYDILATGIGATLAHVVFARLARSGPARTQRQGSE
jgi:hypothetical protein